MASKNKVDSLSETHINFISKNFGRADYSFALGNDTYNWINNTYLSGFSFNIGLLVGRF